MLLGLILELDFDEAVVERRISRLWLYTKF
jgi:hypothetical protein